MTEPNGKPVEGPVDLEVSFFLSPTGGEPIPGVGPLSFNGVTLRDGVFQITLALSPIDFHAVFADTRTSVYVEVTDVTHQRRYPRQGFSVVPYALKVPVDAKTVSYNGKGEVTVPALSGGSDGQVLSRSGESFAWVTPTSTLGTLLGKPIGSASPAAGQVLTFDGASWVPATPGGGGGGGVSSVSVIAPLAVSNPTTTPQISMTQASGVSGGYLSAADWLTFSGKEAAIAAGTTAQFWRGDKTWQALPVATNGAAGVIKATTGKLTVDGTGAITAIAADSAAAFTGSFSGDLTGGQATTAIAPQAVTTAKLADDAVTDAKVSATAAIATSKLAGPVTAIAGHGLGTAAAQDVGTAAGNVVQLLTGGKLPAVDGSNLTNLPAASVNWAVPGAIGSTTPNSGAFTTLTTSGQMGVGTPTPSYPLHVQGQVFADDGFGRGVVITPSHTVLYNHVDPAPGYARHRFNATPLTVALDTALVSSGGTWAPNSGSYQFSAFSVDTTIDQTGGANGITRGLFVNPTLTSAADFRAIETTKGNVIFKGGNVGIGTATPAALLSLRSTGTSTDPFVITNSAGTSTLFYVHESSTGNSGIYGSGFQLADTVSWVNGYNAYGNVFGVGTDLPAAGLDVASPMKATSGVAYGTRLKQTLVAQAANDVLAALHIDPTFNDNGKSGVAHNGLIVTNGNVGIGTPSPQLPLHVVGASSLRLERTGWHAVDLKFAQGVTGDFMDFVMQPVDISQKHGYLFQAANGSSYVDALAIDGTGKIGIGTTSPGFTLDVVGDVNTSACFKANGTNLAGGCASDARFKTDVRPLAGALKRIALLNPVRYRYRADEFPERHFGRGVEYGFIAQELENVFPEFVTTDADGYKEVHYGLGLQMQTIAAVKELKSETEAEIQRLRADSARKDVEIDRLKADGIRKDEEIGELRDYLCAKDPAAAFCRGKTP